MNPKETLNRSPVDDRFKQLEQFEKTKLGVKGLVDSGVTRIPQIFHHPQQKTLPHSQPDPEPEPEPIPVIDLSDPEPDLVNRVREASAKFGFFQVVNHGIPVQVMDRLINSVKGFHELDGPDKMKYYRRDTASKGVGVGFYSNYDLFWSKAASWRDTLEVRVGPDPVEPDSIPVVCREEVMEWSKEVKQLGDKLMELLSKGLGLASDRLKTMAYIGRVGMVGHYYPHCPEPDMTVGIGSHTDPGLLTVLLQDEVGGLRVQYQNQWVDLKPVRGALVVNVGDLFQIISNDVYRSGEHCVVANARKEARVSVAVFFSPGVKDNVYGPLPELVSPNQPAIYKHFKFSDFVNRFLTKELDGKSMTNYFRLVNE